MRAGSVVEASEEPVHVDYPHEPGYLFDCRACEIRCHCEGTGNAECVFHAEDNPHRPA